MLALSIPVFLNLKSVLRLLWSSEHKLGSCEEQTTPFRQPSWVENPKYCHKCLLVVNHSENSRLWASRLWYTKGRTKTLQLLIRVLKNREMVAWGTRKSEVKWQYGCWRLQSSSSPMEEESQKTWVKDDVPCDSNSGHLDFCLGGTCPVSDREPHLEIWRRSQHR